jgi:acetylornithine deacetylase/succinyl-diaminopimelate desuccinylase-like protein
MDPSFKADVLKAADRAAEILRQAGARAEVVPTKGYPVVVGDFISSPDHPTVVVYNHMDVQPADPAEWKSQPFYMTIENGVYRGRGTTDDKGPALAVLFAAKYAWEHKIPINVKFVWELEEEDGSQSFEDFLRKNQKRLQCNSVVVSDTIWVSRDKPAIAYGLRGLQCAMIRLRTGNKDVHSGTTGGLARNPVGELCQLIDECYDARTGQVKIPGFYEDVQQANESELENFVQSGFDIDHFQKAHELRTLRTRDVREAAQRIWARPTFEVHGITGGYMGSGVKTIIPHEAEAKISMRLVPNQDPHKILKLFTDFVLLKCPDCQVISGGSSRPYLGEFDGPLADAASLAMQRAFGKQPAFTREGGSIGAVLSMSDVLKVPITFLGLSLPEHGYHAIDENFDWQQAEGGIKLFIHYFDLLSKMKK